MLDRNVLEAFDLETKLRKTIYDILQPIGNKLADVERRVMEMQHSLVDKHEKRLFELEFCLFKTDRQPTIFEQIEERARQIDTSWRENFQDVSSQIAALRGENANLTFDLENLNSLLKMCNNQIKEQGI